MLRNETPGLLVKPIPKGRCYHYILNTDKQPNSLLQARSPYLRQHAYNPVAWQEWSEVAWEQARSEHKLVLVSVGYSACHWCHVMERESFEDHETAELMNRFFVNIKVDREERPDVDAVYMDACQLITGRGGWPLNIFCLPDGRPIHGGTYFPNAAWKQVLLQLQGLWQQDPEKTSSYAAALIEGMQKMELIEQHPEGSRFTRADIQELYETMAAQFDWKEGGPNRSPKFPLPNQYEFLLNLHQITGHREALDFTNLSLLKMASGGIYDQVRGGFSRYSTDPYWFAPHFEKMLYDNAQLVALYSRAFSITGAYVYEEVVRETLAFCFRELETPEGAFMAALDADSEGIEGRYYVWTDEELRQILGDDYAFAQQVFHTKKEGNWEHGLNILHKRQSPAEWTQILNISGETYFSTLKRVREQLFAAQEKREKPGLDDKVITAWNGLMIGALADAGAYLNDQAYTEKAERLANFILERCRNGSGLYRTFQYGTPAINAFLEDYACVIAGLIRLYEHGADERFLHEAKSLTDHCISEFYDADRGLFYFTAASDPALVVRKTDLTDDVIDSANSIMARSLLKLGYLFLEEAYLGMSHQMLNAVRGQVKKYPGWYSGWAQLALNEAYQTLQTEICGPDALKNLQSIHAHLPTCMVLAHADAASTLPIVKDKNIEQNQIYLCFDKACMEPVTEVPQALEIIEDVWGKD